MGFKKGVFGGSPARIQWRLQRVMLSMWILIIMHGILFHFTIGTPLWLLPELYFVGLIVFHTWHWATHQRWLLYPMWKVHMYHHWIVYPPSRFMTTVYLDDEPGRTPLTSLAHDGPLYVGMLANLVLLYRLNLLSHPDLGVCLLVYAFVSAFAIWLHQTFHIKGHWIERFLYFHDLRALHLVHHQGTAKHNYGFLDHSCDLIGNSLATADFSLSNSWNQKTDEDKGAETPPAAASVSQLPSLLLPDQLQSPSSPPSPRSQSSPYTAGIMPTLFNNGLLECCYAMTCVAIEIIVGLLGVIFGNARDKENPKALNAPKETGTNSPPHLTPNEDISLKPKKLYGSSSGSGSASPDYEELTADCYPKPITYPEWTKIFLFN